MRIPRCKIRTTVEEQLNRSHMAGGELLRSPHELLIGPVITGINICANTHQSRLLFIAPRGMSASVIEEKLDNAICVGMDQLKLQHRALGTDAPVPICLHACSQAMIPLPGFNNPCEAERGCSQLDIEPWMLFLLLPGAYA